MLSAMIAGQLPIIYFSYLSPQFRSPFHAGISISQFLYLDGLFRNEHIPHGRNVQNILQRYPKDIVILLGYPFLLCGIEGLSGRVVSKILVVWLFCVLGTNIITLTDLT